MINDLFKNIDSGDTNHIKPQLIVHTIVTLAVWGYMESQGVDNPVFILNWLIKGNLIVMAIMAVVWFLFEHFQEKAMCKKDPKRKYHFSIKRWRDILFPEIAGSLFPIILSIILYGFYYA